MIFFIKIIKNTFLYGIVKRLYLYIKYIKSFIIQLIKVREPYSGYPNYPSFEIKEKNKHVFFGYYDKSPFNISNDKLLYLSVPRKRVTNNIGVIKLFDLKTNAAQNIDSTYAWSWQQGTMLQWLKKNKNEFIYNIFDEQDKTYKAKTYNIKTNEIRFYNKPIYSLGKLTNKFLSLNFYRLDKFARGYGYSRIPEITYEEDNQDGIWEVNMDTSDINFLISIEEIKNYCYKEEFELAKHYINHVDYYKNDNAVIFIHRWFINNNNFKSRLLTYNLKTKELKTLLDNQHVSHFCWKTDNELLIYATNSNFEKGYFEINVDSVDVSEIIKGLPLFDGHPSYSPDKKFILTDSYPNEMRKQKLLIYDIENNSLNIIKEFYTSFKFFDDYRCDLHPRWSNDGKWISVDTTFSGKRSLYFINVDNE